MREGDAAGGRKSNWVFLLNMFILVKSYLNEEQGLAEGKKISKSNLKSVFKGMGIFSGDQGKIID